MFNCSIVKVGQLLVEQQGFNIIVGVSGLLLSNLFKLTLLITVLILVLAKVVLWSIYSLVLVKKGYPSIGILA